MIEYPDINFTLINLRRACTPEKEHTEVIMVSKGCRLGNMMDPLHGLPEHNGQRWRAVCERELSVYQADGAAAGDFTRASSGTPAESREPVLSCHAT